MRLTRFLHRVSARRRGGRLHSRLSHCVGALVMAACVSGFAVAPASAEQAASRALAFQHGLLDAGSHHTCAIVGGGDVRCWGEGEDGRLGYGNVDDIGDTETPASVPPVALGGKAVAVSAGGAHTCAVLETGAVRCWGYGNDGQLGYGNGDSIGDTETPASVAPVVLGAKAVAISAGAYHSCALLETGRVRCWGYGAEGSLG
jgi:alpha-tubulin suppressor-like RCC1 family protein